MTDEIKEGAPATGESQELVIPELSEEEQEVQQPSVTLSGLTEERLIEILDERAETQARKDQSAKDRAVSRNAKDIADILERFKAGGSDEAAFIAEADQQATLEATQTWQAGIESRLATMTAPTKQNWEDEWDVDSQKILDAAEADDGTVLTNDEYNAAFFGQKFASRGDAYVALNQAINAKRGGAPAPVSASAVVTEGGEVPRTPEPTVPKEFLQQLDEASTPAEQDALVAARWKELDKERSKTAFAAEMEAKGYSAEDFIEKSE